MVYMARAASPHTYARVVIERRWTWSPVRSAWSVNYSSRLPNKRHWDSWTMKRAAQQAGRDTDSFPYFD